MTSHNVDNFTTLSFFNYWVYMEVFTNYFYIIFIIIIIIRQSPQCTAGREWEHSQYEDPQPHTTNSWKEKKDKIVGDKIKSRSCQQESIGSALKWFIRNELETHIIFNMI